MADYNSDRTGANIDATLDKVDVRDTVIDIGSNTTNRITVDSTGNVGIGTSSPQGGLHVNAPVLAELHLTNNTTGQGASDGTSLIASLSDLVINNREFGNIRVFNNGSERMRIDASGNLLVGTTTSPSGSGQIVASNGVYLGGTGAANKLDDYETGAFTPTLTASTTSDFNYAVNDGHYVKIGDLVYFTVAIALSSKGTSSGAITLDGLPFVQADTLAGTSIESALTFSYWSSITVQSLIGYVNGSSSSCILRKILSGNTGATEDAITAADIGNAFSFRVQGTYIAQ